LHDFIIPRLGQEDSEIEILSIKVRVGDKVEVDDPIVEIESEKSTTVLKAERAGMISEIVLNEGDIVEVGAVVCRIDEK
jgi:pyruvate/2-oxoglutarate dehydrogenase complex dihydrolipoamide acyltransferase (E2) component